MMLQIEFHQGWLESKSAIDVLVQLKHHNLFHENSTEIRSKNSKLQEDTVFSVGFNWKVPCNRTSCTLPHEEIFDENHQAKAHNMLGLPKAATNASHQRFSDTLTCFEFNLNKRRCSAVACSGAEITKNTASNSFVGFVKEIKATSSRRGLGSCQVCRVYQRHCAVSQAFNFTYIHVMKAGGSSFHDFLRGGLCPHPSECNPRFLEIMNCEQAIRQFPDFFKFTFIRHPLPRAASAWAMASRPEYLPENTTAVTSFSDWVEDPSLLSTAVMSMHWWPQVSFLLDSGRCPIYDFAGVLDDRFTEDLETVLRRINATVLSHHYRRSGFPHSYASEGGRSHSALANASAAAVRALLRRYRDDFAYFGFDAGFDHYPRP
jgi:hypothetical protein